VYDAASGRNGAAADRPRCAYRGAVRGDEPELNPAQADTLARLGAPAGERPQFDAGLRHELRAVLEHELAPIVDELPPGEGVFVSKFPLAQVHGCEARYVASRAEEFEWTVPLARGTVAHKAIELTLNWRGEAAPGALVDEALARLANGDAAVTDFLQRIEEADRAELRAQATERVSKFLECFPPLSVRWMPVVESRIYTQLLDERVTLQGRVDLTLGRSQGTTAGKVIVDLKTGTFAPAHRDDLRFYALVETLRMGVPPRLVATYYLDTARAETEAVTEELLEAACRRVIAGIERMVTLTIRPDEALKRPGPVCRWCRLLPECAEGQAHRAERQDRGDASDWSDEEW
jgi:hypothetical protein